MDRRVRWLRISYWTGAIIDALAAIQMLFPGVFAATNRLSGFNPPWEYRYAMGMGASLMLGWTALLLWADRSPVERRSILILTAFPVVVGLAMNNVWAISSRFISLSALAPVLIGQAALVFLFAFSYLNSRNIADAGLPAQGGRSGPTGGRPLTRPGSDTLV